RRPRNHGARARLARGQGAPRRRRALHRPHQDIPHRGESDRRMKITAVTPFLVDPGYGKNWLFVKVETADGLHGWGECYTQADREVVDTVRAVREAVGPDVDLLIECHRRLAPMHAVRLARRLEAFDPFWYEEPVSSRDLGALAECRREITIPIVTGEELYTRFEFREVFERRAADIINPDVCNVGGIEELREIAAMAEAYHVVVSTHNYNSTTVGLAATLQVSAAIPNFLITEYFVNFDARRTEIAVNPLRAEG